MKTCQKCKVEYELSNFNKNRRKPDGINIYCKTCVGEHNRKFHENHPGYAREYYLTNKIAVQESVERWCKRNMEKVRAYSRRYYNENRDMINAKRRVANREA